MVHSMADPAHGHYRTKEELDEQKKRDPLLLFSARLRREGLLTDTVHRQIAKEVEVIIQEAVDFAEASPEPPPEALFEDVHA